MPQDRFDSASDSVTAPARSCFAVTPNDNAEFAMVAKAVYVGLGGDVVPRAQDDDSDVTFREVQGGVFFLCGPWLFAPPEPARQTSSGSFDEWFDPGFAERSCAGQASGDRT